MQSSRAEEVRAVGGVAATGFGQAASRIAEIHQAVADRSFGASGPGGKPAKLAHDAISAGVYAAVRGVGGALIRAGGAAASLRQGADAPPLSETPAGTHALAALSGAFGDALEREGSPLAVRMSVREDGREVPMDSEAVARAFPDATPRVAVFTHGLCESEAGWHLAAERHHGDAGSWHGSRLRADLGFTPVKLRVNTGLRISDERPPAGRAAGPARRPAGRSRSRRSCWWATRWAA